MLGIIIGGSIADDDDLHLTVTTSAADGGTVQYLDAVSKEFYLTLTQRKIKSISLLQRRLQLVKKRQRINNGYRRIR